MLGFGVARGVFWAGLQVEGTAWTAVKGGDSTPTYLPVHSPRSEGSSVCVRACVRVCLCENVHVRVWTSRFRGGLADAVSRQIETLGHHVVVPSATALDSLHLW